MSRARVSQRSSGERTEDWSVYVIRCGDGTLYTGIATDVQRRFAEHARGTGAKYLRGRGPLRIVFATSIGPRSLALRAESRIKRLRKAQKEALTGAARNRPTH